MERRFSTPWSLLGHWDKGGKQTYMEYLMGGMKTWQKIVTARKVTPKTGVSFNTTQVNKASMTHGVILYNMREKTKLLRRVDIKRTRIKKRGDEMTIDIALQLLMIKVHWEVKSRKRVSRVISSIDETVRIYAYTQFPLKNYETLPPN